MSRGADRERQVARLLHADGWVAYTTKHSGDDAWTHGLADVIAIQRPTLAPMFARVLLVQVKSTADGPYKNFGPEEREALQAEAERCGGEAWLCWWAPRKQARWIPAAAWPQARAAA